MKGREVVFLAELELLFDEAEEVVVARELDGGAVGDEGLDEDFAFHLAPACASGDLGEEGEGAFASTEVGGVEGEVGIEDADEGDVGEVEAFGNHLGAEEDVDFAGLEVGEGALEDVFLADGVAVEAGEAGFGEDFTEDFFDLFGAVALQANGGVLALGADAGDDGLVAAEVADEAFFGAVIGDGDGAVGALAGVAAGGTGERAGEAAAVEEEDDLVSGGELLVHGVAQALGEDGWAAFLGLVAHVDDADEGEGLAVGTLFEGDELVFGCGFFVFLNR